MGTINKTIYESPTITLKQVMMESDIMAASGSEMTDDKIYIKTTEQSDGENFEFKNTSYSWTQDN